jgi:hypothetical protein
VCTEDLVVRNPANQAQVSAQPTQVPSSSTLTSGPVSISSPGPGSVSGVVPIMGSASTGALQYYRIDFGRGSSPSSWSSIGQWSLPISGGQLAVWNTGGLAPGAYTLRLTVQDGARGTLSTSVQVNIGP